jgi:hypothetical protein
MLGLCKIEQLIQVYVLYTVRRVPLPPFKLTHYANFALQQFLPAHVVEGHFRPMDDVCAMSAIATELKSR